MAKLNVSSKPKPRLHLESAVIKKAQLGQTVKLEVTGKIVGLSEDKWDGVKHISQNVEINKIRNVVKNPTKSRVFAKRKVKKGR